MGSIGMPELILIFLAILLIFGAKRIPEIARGLGKGIKEFKSATREIQSELNVHVDDRPQIQQPRPPAQTPAPRAPVETTTTRPEPPQQNAGSTGASNAS